MSDENRTKKVCAVAVCKSPKDKKTINHSFPNDELIKSEWQARCLRKEIINAKNASVCSHHFLETDYERDLQHELMGLPTRKKLKIDALPSQNLSPVDEIDELLVSA